MKQILSFIIILIAGLITTEAQQATLATNSAPTEPQGPAAAVVRNCIAAAALQDALASKVFLSTNCVDDPLEEFQINIKARRKYSEKNSKIRSEAISSDGKSAIVDVYLLFSGTTYSISKSSSMTFFLALHGSGWKITKIARTEPRGPAAAVVRNYIAAAVRQDALACKTFLNTNCMDDLLEECQSNTRDGLKYSEKNSMIDSERFSTDEKSATVHAYFSFVGTDKSFANFDKTFFLVLEETGWKISDDPNRRPNEMFGEGFKDFGEVKEPLSSNGSKSAIIIRSFKKLASVTAFTGGFATTTSGITPTAAESKPAAGMAYVRIIFDVSLESIPTVLWKRRIELVVDGEKPVTPFELVRDGGTPNVSLYGIDGLNFTKNPNRLAVTLEVKDTDSEKMVFKVNGKSYGTLKNLLPTSK